MSQTKGSNAHSWRAANHIRTDQSKWLDTNLHEMEHRVQSMLKIIEEDADSFAKRAEMYYKRRPELINSVEETYRAYRALAERYDRLSGELHKANNALATAFPDVQFPLQDEDFDVFPNSSIPTDSTEIQSPPPPEVSSFGLLNKNSENNTIPKKSTENKSPPRNVTSHMNEGEAKEVIGKLQKDILEMQTEKEFIKSSYERGITKYWEIEKRITEIQEEVGFLQDEFGVTAVIKDDEARALMAATVLKSCKDTLINLQEQESKSIKDTKIESEKIKTAQERLKALKSKYCQPEREITEIIHKNTGEKATTTNMEEQVKNLQQDSIELQSAHEKVKDQIEIDSDTSIVDHAEKIDDLVNNVISLELTVSSQTAIIKHLKSETDELQKQLKCLEEEKASLIIDSNGTSDQLKQAEEKLQKIQNLEKHAQHEKLLLRNDFTEVCHSLSGNSDELQSPIHHKPAPQLERDSPQATDNNHLSCEVQAQSGEPEDASNTGQLLLNGFEGCEKTAAEYIVILESYSETQRKLLEVEKKNQAYFSETMAQVKELKSANAIKEDEIRSLQKTLSSLQTNLEATNKKFMSSAVQDGGILGAEKDMKPSYRSDEPQTMSLVEEKLIKDIDRLVDENLALWLKFSTSFHQISKFRTEFQKLQADVERLKESDTRNSCAGKTEKSESAPIDKGLRELKTELQVWEEENTLLKREVQNRFCSLCNIQNDISRALKASAEAAFIQFTPYQAAKFQGEVLNMKQENNKMAEELEVRLDHMKGLEAEVEKTLTTLSKDHMHSKLSSSKNGHHNLSSKSGGVPLRSFLYGVKPKKPSFFSFMNPASSNKHHSDSRGGRS